MDIKFDFEKDGKSFFGQIYTPTAKVSFYNSSRSNWVTAWLIVDTGADMTTLPKYMAESLNISLERDCWKDKTNGVGGNEIVYIYKQKIKVRLGDNERTVPISFLNTDRIPALLGRLGFLETFDTEFLKSHVVVFKN
ncbi:MAG: retropepsin-like aspartic protease [Patescibacteria group bacterium]